MKLLNFTLPDLEDRLDSLTEGALCQLSARDYERLFGVNHAAKGRVRNFAKLHACIVSFTDKDVLFRKQLQATRPGRD